MLSVFTMVGNVHRAVKYSFGMKPPFPAKSGKGVVGAGQQTAETLYAPLQLACVAADAAHVGCA